MEGKGTKLAQFYSPCLGEQPSPHQKLFPGALFSFVLGEASGDTGTQSQGAG